MPTWTNPCTYLPRRLQVVVSLTTFVLLCVLFFGSSTPEDPLLTAQNALHPFRTPAHNPPTQSAEDTTSEATWFEDLKWRNPFSHIVTQDERVLLPPLRKRPPIYTYFDPGSGKKDEKIKKTEQNLLRIWRRAWWAKGFKPVVLSASEAMNNPLYKQVQALDLRPEMRMEMMRWLAWGNMGTGILCNWLAVPMAHYDDPLLAFLRKGEYTSLTRYEDLESGLFVGTKTQIDEMLRVALDSADGLAQAKSIIDTVPRGAFHIDPDHDSIAFYSSPAIRKTYKLISEKLDGESSRAEGLAMLPPLINSHLHTTWQNHFTKGIHVLKPFAKNTTSLVGAALDIARNLSQCASSPIQASCPPNQPRCSPCVSSRPMTVLTPPIFRNSSSLFTIATVPHPWTLQGLIHDVETMSMRYLRRNTSRDAWILAASGELLGTGVSSFARLAGMKDAIASEFGSARSLWLPAEEPLHLHTEYDREELDWLFGFEIPRTPLKDGKSLAPHPGHDSKPPIPKQEFDGPMPSEEQLARQKKLLDTASNFVKRSEKGLLAPISAQKKEAVALRDAVEAWNMADTEIWKFVRAFNSRRRVERTKWLEDEEIFQGKGVYDRWKEKVAG